MGFVLATRNLTGLLSGQPPRYRCHLGCILLKMPAVSLPTGVALGRLSDYIGRFRCYLIALTCEGVMAFALVTGAW